MDAVHLHLILNHLPMLGVVFAGGLFAVALRYRSGQFQRVALVLMLLFALSAIPVFLTGEPAEEAVERVPGVSEAVIDRHEDAAGAALTAMAALGGLSLVGVLVWRRAPQVPRTFAAAVLLVTLATSALFAWTGYLGGQIRHTEIRSTALAGAPSGGEEAGDRGEHDDD